MAAAAHNRHEQAVGPVDAAIQVSTAAFAVDLPLNASGLLLLRLARELKDAHIEDELTQAFLKEGFTGNGQIPPLSILEAMRQRRSKKVLRASAGMVVLSIFLTLLGLEATLWHMGWWISIGFLVMVAGSFFVAILVVANSQGSSPKEQGEQMDGIQDEVTRVAKEHGRQE